MTRPVRVAVVGGGVTGLAAALRLRDRLGPAAHITVWEKDRAPGGKLRTGTVAGRRCELGAEAFLVRDPGGRGESAAFALARRLGLDLVHPAPVPPGLYVDGALHPLPGGTLMGVPADPATVAAVAPVDVARDRDTGRPVLPDGQDTSVGALVRQRLGDAVVERLGDPLLGGVYAGRADDLSLRATMPGLAAACGREPTLTGAVRAALAAARRPAEAPAGPSAGAATDRSAPAADPAAAGRRAGATPSAVFATPREGMSAFVAALVAAGGAEIRTGRPVRELLRTGGGGSRPGWRLVVGATRDPELVDVDAVVLALPARPAARLLRSAGEPAAAHVGALDYASVALVTLAYPDPDVLPERSGFLVPATEGTTVKAATFFTRKWPHLAGGPALVRLSVGRYGEEHVLRLTDEELADRAHRELSRVLGARLPGPVGTHVQRWGGALPQYAPGHLDRVAAARAALPPTLVLAGAGYDGVGIPACVKSGQAAADALVAALEESAA
ncbi:MAG: protoporphyrinogen oxidase [Micromonosporaceae bacterium]